MTSSLIATPGNPKGLVVDIIKKLDTFYTEGSFKIKVQPFSRSIISVRSGLCDFHLPLIQPESGLINFTDQPITHVAFVIYSPKGKPVTKETLAVKLIDTIMGHAALFPFKTNELTDEKSAFFKLNAGRLDAFLYAQEPADAVLNTLEYGFNITRNLYKTMPSGIVLPDDKSHAKRINDLLMTALNKAKKDDEFNLLVSKMHQPYDNWQP